MQYWKNRKVKPPKSIPEEKIDSDVLDEARLISSMSQTEKEDKLVVLDRVTKYYGKFLAVNQVSVCIRSKECFGLMGINGAGKTSTFKMMTGDEAISYGDAYMGGKNLRTKRRKVAKNYGYCPQFDALLGLLTARETIKIFSLLRGIRRKSIHTGTMELSHSLGFAAHLDKLVDHFSGGNKRKLSTAIALIGSPAIVFLDEPTSTMDPIARLNVFACLEFMRDHGKSLVLTSHDLNECEALCKRMVIMVNGVFKCMGSVQHLKNKFSKGITLKIKLQRADSLHDAEKDSHMSVESDNVSPSRTKLKRASILPGTSSKVKNFIQHKFPNAVLQEEQHGFLTYYISSGEIPLSDLFNLMERYRQKLHFEDYTIDQTRLEEIFLEFAREQKEENLDTSTGQR